MYWFRTGLGVLGGGLAELLTGCKVILPPAANAGTCVGSAVPDYSTGILVWVGLYLLSFYLIKWTYGKKLDKDEQRKIVTTGIGSFILLFIFTWVILFTLGVSYLNF